ncbi:hypothetical protein COBT_000163 [Conglomerata obtusa]
MICTAPQENSDFDIISTIQKINIFVEKYYYDQRHIIKTAVWDKYISDNIFYIQSDDVCLRFYIKSQKFMLKRIDHNYTYSGDIECYKANVKHRNICDVYLGFTQYYNGAWIDWLIIETLSQPPEIFTLLSELQIKKMCHDVCLGLKYLHVEKKIIHRNICRSNVLYTRENRRINEEVISKTIADIITQLNVHNHKDSNYFFNIPIHKPNELILDRQISNGSTEKLNIKQYKTPNTSSKSKKLSVMYFLSKYANLKKKFVVEDLFVEYFHNRNGLFILTNKIKYKLEIVVLKCKSNNNENINLLIIVSDNKRWAYQSIILENELVISVMEYEVTIVGLIEFLLNIDKYNAFSKKSVNEMIENYKYKTKYKNINYEIFNTKSNEKPLYKSFLNANTLFLDEIINVSGFFIFDLNRILQDAEIIFKIANFDLSTNKNIGKCNNSPYNASNEYFLPISNNNVSVNFKNEYFSPISNNVVSNNVASGYYSPRNYNNVINNVTFGHCSPVTNINVSNNVASGYCSPFGVNNVSVNFKNEYCSPISNNVVSKNVASGYYSPRNYNNVSNNVTFGHCSPVTNINVSNNVASGYCSPFGNDNVSVNFKNEYCSPSSNSNLSYMVTRGYCSPEIYNNIEISYATDIWSLGILAFQYWDKNFSELLQNLNDDILVHNYIKNNLNNQNPKRKISANFENFLQICLNDKSELRPKINNLINHYFLN